MADMKWCRMSSVLQADSWAKSVCCALLVWSACAANTAQAQAGGVCRVIENAEVETDADGSTWAAAMTLDDALAASRCAEIWVRYGTYKPTIVTQPRMREPERSKTFLINRPLKLYGGFAGTESTLNARVLDADRPTVLSGDVLGNDLYVTTSEEDPVYVSLRRDNSMQVLVIGGIELTGNGQYTPQNTVVDGVTITAGSALNGWNLGADGYFGSGGGLLCNGSGAGNVCSPTLSNIIFFYNSAVSGGALANLAFDSGTSSPVISGAIFDSNLSTSSGHAIANWASGIGAVSSPVLSNVQFLGQIPATGHGVLRNEIRGGGTINVTVRDSIFERNASNGGAFDARCYDDDTGLVGSITVTGERLSLQKNSPGSGGLAAGQAGRNCRVTQNFKDVNYSNNGSDFSHAALIKHVGTGGIVETNVTNATVHGNRAKSALVFLTDVGHQWHSTMRATLTNVTITENTLTDPAGVLFYSDFAPIGGIAPDPAGATGSSSIAVRGSIAWDNTMPGGLHGGDKMASNTIEHSLVQGGAPGAGNVNVSPELGPLADNGGFSMTRMPSASSPAVGNGASGGYACSDVAQSPATDQRGVARPQNGRCDMGAVERMVPTLSVSTSGAGTVSSTPAGIQACATSPTPAGTCTTNFEDGTGAVVLTATASAGSRLIGWSGEGANACSAGSNTCTVLMDAGRAITAHFAATVSTPGGNVDLELPGSQCVLSSGPSYNVTPASGLPVGYREVGYGQIGFSATGCPHGGAVNVRLTLASNVPAGAQLWKWNGSAWVRWTATISGNTVQFSVVDKVAVGGAFQGDTDPVPGTITDPVVLLVPLAPAPGATTAIPTLSQWGLLITALLLAALAASQHQRIRQAARSRQR